MSGRDAKAAGTQTAIVEEKKREDINHFSPFSALINPHTNITKL